MDSEDSALEWNRTAFSCFFDNWFLFDWFSFFDAALRAADFDPSEPIPYLEKKYINRSFHFKKPELCSIEFYLAIRSHFRFGLLTDTIIRHQKRTSFIFSFCCWDGRDLWEIRTDWSGRRPTSDGPIRRFFRFDFFFTFLSPSDRRPAAFIDFEKEKIISDAIDVRDEMIAIPSSAFHRSPITRHALDALESINNGN